MYLLYHCTYYMMHINIAVHYCVYYGYILFIIYFKRYHFS